jgi:hypothetical protein
MAWSTWLDLHQRSLGSEPSALAAGLHVEEVRRVSRPEMPPAAVTPHGGPERGIRAKHVASESNTAPRIWTPEPSQTATYEEAPPRGFEPQPATFAESCPSMERWYGRNDLFVWMTGIAPVTSWLSPTRSAAELHPGYSEPPRGFEPQPTRFVVSCPVLGSVAMRLGGWNRTSGPVVPSDVLCY